MFQCKNMQNSNANSGQNMFVVGKFCRNAKPRGYEGCK